MQTVVQNYQQYSLSWKELGIYTLQFLCILGMVSYLFFDTYIGMLFGMAGYIPYLKQRKKQQKKKRLEVLNLQFREAILSMAAAQKTGYSVENSLLEALKDMKVLYGPSYIVSEWEEMIRKVQFNIPVEQAFAQMADKTGLEDIRMFSQVFSIAKRSGGDVANIMHKAASNIYEKSEVKREIDVLITAKKYEQKIMNLVPFVIILYIRITSYEMIEPLYTSVIGRSVMIGCLILYLLSLWLSEKIVGIEV